MKKGIKNKIAMLVIVTFLSTLIVGIIPADHVQAASLSQKEQKYYSKILKEKQYIEDTGHSIYDDASFILYDINGDGYKELIVSGPLGLRCAFFSIIYSYDGKKFHKTETINGEVSAVSKNGITFTYDDYAQAGIERYHSVTTYKLGSKGKLTKKINEYLETRFDEYTAKDDTVDHSYYKIVNDKEVKITKKIYKKAYQKYKFKTVGYNYSYEENGKTISHKCDIQLHQINDNNIKKFIK